MNAPRTKHTPGPWTALRRGNRCEIHGREETVAALYMTFLDEDDANVRLILAAPLLLEALQALAPHFDLDLDGREPDAADLDHLRAQRAALAAIEAATGGAP